MTTLESLYRLYKQTQPSDPLKEKAWQALEQKGIPTKKWESFRYVSLHKLYRSSWTLPEAGVNEVKKSSSALVFVDGQFKPAFSTIPDTLIVLPLQEAYTSYGTLLKKRFAKSVQCDPDPFVLLNHALYRDGLFLYIAPNQKLEAPLEFFFIQTTSQKISCPKIDLFVGKGAEAATLATYVQQEEIRSWNNGVFHLTLEEGAQLTHFDNGAGLQNGFGFQAVRALLKKNSRFRTFAFTASSACIRHDLRVILAGENAETELKGLHLLKRKGEAHTHIHVQHAAPQAKSYQHYKSVVTDSACSSFSGKIYVEKEAQQTDAYQLNNNLLLGEKAKAMSQPNLEVFADDVKASHGATCARPSAEELFYLKTRGLSTPDAERQLTNGFCRELIEAITLEPLQAQLKQIVEQFLTRG